MILWRVVDAYQLLILFSAIMSWVPSEPGSVIDQIRTAVAALTEPFLNLFRRILPGFGSSLSLDFSPVVAIIVLDVIKRLL
ncbi:MAG: YggT family protein [Atopobiaceae bacterium]|nr:YggT family protein [Atopobiaceae bacterium]